MIVKTFFRALTCFIFGVTGFLWAPIETLAAAPPVSVENIRFDTIKLSGLSDNYLETAIELRGGKNPDPKALNRKYVNNIKVILSLGFEIAPGQFRFFKSEALIATLEKGKSAKVFFYLLPEVVNRDNLPKEPYAYRVDLEVAGRAVPPTRNNISSSLNKPGMPANFKARVQLESRENDGILLPIYETLFWNVYTDQRRLKVSPDYIRKASD